jgi:hypothetical protein
MLMDRGTLLAHRSQWVTEPSQADTPPDLLDPDEASLYRDLADGTLGPSIRLEQERIRFSALEQALRCQPSEPAGSFTRTGTRPADGPIGALPSG